MQANMGYMGANMGANMGNIPCIFPFHYGGHSFKGCVPLADTNEYWCTTYDKRMPYTDKIPWEDAFVDREDYKHGIGDSALRYGDDEIIWGICEESCPVICRHNVFLDCDLIQFHKSSASDPQDFIEFN